MNRKETRKVAYKTINSLWRTLNKKLAEYTNKEIPFRVTETISGIWKDHEYKPLIHKKFQTEWGWHFVINLPAHISFDDFACKYPNFKTQLGTELRIEQHGRATWLMVPHEALKINYNYDELTEEDTKNKLLPLTVGIDMKGKIIRDLKEAPMLFIAGVTGSGKSTMLTIVIVELMQTAFVIAIDPKRTQFTWARDYLTVVWKVHEAYALLKAVSAELERRQELFDHSGTKDIIAYREKGYHLDFFCVVIDELAELLRQADKAGLDIETELLHLVTLGRQYGIHIIAATQKPDTSGIDSKRFTAIRSQFDCRICFYMSSEMDSRTFLDNGKAAKIKHTPGRAILRWKDIDDLEVQIPNLTEARAAELLEQTGRRCIFEIPSQKSAFTAKKPRQSNFKHLGTLNNP